MEQTKLRCCTQKIKQEPKAADDVFMLCLWVMRDSVLERCNIPIISFVLWRHRAHPVSTRGDELREKMATGDFFVFGPLFYAVIHKSSDPFKEWRVNVDAQLVHSEGKSLKKLTERKGTGLW